MTPAEWTAFTDVLRGIDARKAKTIISDGAVTDKEMNHLLDLSGNGSLGYYDFVLLKLPLFKSVKEILRKHKMSAYKFWTSPPEPFDRYAIANKFLGDKVFVLAMVKKWGPNLKYASAALKKDKEVVLAAMNQHSMAFKYADISFRRDRTFVLAAVKKYDWALAGAVAALRKDKEIVLTALKRNGLQLEFADAAFLKDKKTVLIAMKSEGAALKYADAAFRKDKTFVLASIKAFNNVLRGASAKLRKDKEVVRAAVRKNGKELEHADASLRKDKEIVLLSVKKNGNALFHADASLKKDKAVVLAAVKENGLALVYADAALQKDKEVVLAAVKQYGPALVYAHAALRKDKHIVLAAVNEDASALKYADATLRKDKDIVRAYNLGHSIDACFNNSSLHTFLKGDKGLRNFFSVNELKDKQSFLAALKQKYEIDFPKRFENLKVLLEILKNRKTAKQPPASDKRPLCIVIYPKKDWNKSFENGRIENMMKLGYRVVYYEANNESAAKKYLKLATTNGRYRAKTIFLGGHGTVKNLALGGCDRSRPSFCTPWDEGLYIDTSDFKKQDEFQFARYLSPDGHIILESCSNGAGGAKNPLNLANTIARTLPPGMTVHSATKPGFIWSVTTRGGKLVITYSNNANYTTAGTRRTSHRKR
jgi:hypothetical protein